MPIDFIEETQAPSTIDFVSDEAPEPSAEEKRQTYAFEKAVADVQARQAKGEAILSDVGRGAATAIVQAASKVDPTGFFQNMMARQGIPQSQLVPPEVIRGDIEIAEQFARQALGNVGLESLIPPPSVSEPIKEFAAENIASLPEIAPALALGTAQPRPVARLFQVQMAAALPQSVQALQEAETPSEKLKAGLGVAAGVALPTAIELGLRQPIPEVPPFRGTQIPMPEGARPTPPTPLPKPTVPETAATVYETAAAEARRKGADTINKILALFPSLEGNRTKAREIRDVAFPKTKGAEEYATRIEREPEYIGTPPRPEIPEEPSQIRKGEGEQDRNRGGVQRSTQGEEAPRTAPQPGGVLLTPEERLAEQRALDEALGQETEAQLPVDKASESAKTSSVSEAKSLLESLAEKHVRNILAGKELVEVSGKVPYIVKNSEFIAELKKAGIQYPKHPNGDVDFIAFQKWAKPIADDVLPKWRRALKTRKLPESTPPPKETPTAPSAAEPSQLTPATQGISEATTPSEKAQELPVLRKADVESDPRLEMPGITKQSKPNSLIVALRDLESVPVKEIVLKSSGDPLTDAKTVEATIRKYAGQRNISLRESLAVTTGPNGRAILKFGISPRGMTWVSAKNWIDAVEGRKAQRTEAPTPQVSTEPFLGKTKAEWTPEYYKSLSPENRRAARAQVIRALKSEGGTTRVTQESKPPIVLKAIHELLDLREKKKAATPIPPTPEQGPGMIGMGGAATGELAETVGADIYGIAQRVREQRAAAGQTPALPRGEGVSALETVHHGRRLIAADPLAAQKAVDAFDKTKAVSYDGIAAVRAKGEEAFMAARNIEQKFGTDSPEYRNAFEAASRWDKASKGMQTEWHKQGQAQQGQTDIDTGTFTGLQRAFRAVTGKDFTPQQAQRAKQVVATVKGATAEAEAATKKLFDAIDKVLPQGKAPIDAADARKQLGAFKTGAKPNLQQIRSIWSYVKSVYISRGESNLDAIAQKASEDLGIPKIDIIKAMASPKGARALTDEAFLKLQRQRQAISSAKNWLYTANMPGWERFLRKVPRFFFMTKVFGHGTVGMITHAGSMMFDPAAMKTYWPVFFKQYGLVFSERYHARMMQELMDDPYFVTARRAGLANDPFRYQDDYQNPKLSGWVGKWGLAGNRGFDSLKLIRQARWNQIWDSFPDELKTKEMAKLLADQVNHATGIVRSDVLGRFAEPAGTILFAPKLEMSRWAFAIGDPAKATKIFLSWEKATPEERMFAISEVEQKARIFGVYMGLLALNESILQASNSEQHVNFTNPYRGDYLAFKVAGQNVSIISPMLHMAGLLANLTKIAFLERKGVQKLTPRRAAAAEAIGRYSQGKLSPFAQPIADVVFQSTFENRPMPFSADRASKWMRSRGMGRWTWPEYAAQTFSPIPVSEALREVWRSQGMDENEIDKAVKALAVLTITGGTGARLSEDIHKGGK